MKIQIETDSISAYEVRQLVKLLCATVCGVASQLEDLDSADQKQPRDMTTEELREAVETMNRELYARSTEKANTKISPDDNPSAGVEKAALNSDARGELAQFSNESLTQRFNDEVVKPALAPIVAALEAVDLASVFAQADMINADLQSAVDTLVDRGRETPSSVALDRAGLPWDSRIHAASKAINQTDGLWRQRRGVDKNLVATVEAQLRQAQSVPPAGDTHGSADLDADAAKLEAMGDDAGMTVGDIESAGGVTGQLARQIVPPPPSPAQAVDTGEIDTFPRLLKFITEQKLAGKLNQPQVAAALIAIGIEGPLPVLQARPDLIPAMAAKLHAIGGV